MPQPPLADRLLAQAAQAHAGRRWDEAEATLRQVLAIAPRNQIALHSLGMLLRQLGRIEEAEAALRQALVAGPASAPILYLLSQVLMAQGKYAEAWPLWAVRHQLPALNLPTPQGVPYPEWRGEDLTGRRIVIFPEQGFGDQIQFARFTPLLQARGASVTLLCWPGLERLFADSFPDVEVVAAAGQASFSEPDFWTMAGALPGHLHVTLETIPSAPYLRAAAATPNPPAGFKVGLATRGNPRHTNDANRSLSAADAAGLADLPGQVISLDPADTGAKDFADTAAIIAELDVVVSVDTSVAHLAGALGKPALVLIPAFSTDWRWLYGRDDSPWYPSLQLFRGDLREGWGPAIDRVRAEAAARMTRAQRRG